MSLLTVYLSLNEQLTLDTSSQMVIPSTDKEDAQRYLSCMQLYTCKPPVTYYTTDPSLLFPLTNVYLYDIRMVRPQV